MMGRGPGGASAEPIQQYNASAEVDGTMFGRRKTAFAMGPNLSRPAQMVQNGKAQNRSDADFNFANQVQGSGNLAINSRSKSPIGPANGLGGNPMGPRGAGHHNMSQVNL